MRYFLALTFLIFSFSILAQPVITNGVLISWSNASGEITIPQTVVALADKAFMNNSSITAVKMPTQVKKIGVQCFYNCSKLTSIEMPGVNSIGYQAFYGCTELLSVDIPDEITIIDYATFQNCYNLSSIKFNQKLAEVSESAFEKCISLTKIELPASVTAIQKNAFYRCIGIDTINLGPNLTTLGDNALANCLSLTSIKLPTKIKEIGAGCFSNSSITEISIPSSVTFIGDNTFSGCVELSKIQIGDKDSLSYTLSLPANTFSNCTSVKKLIINREIADDKYSSAFFKLTNLEEVEFGDKVTQIVTFAFYGLTKLTKVTGGSNISYIGTAAYQGCSSLSSVEIPSKVSYIPAQIFWGCTSLRTVNFPENVFGIGTFAFKDCSSISSIKLPSGLRAINVSAFENCTSLRTIESAASKAPNFARNCFAGVDTLNCQLKIPVGSMESYRTTANWKSFVNTSEININQVERKIVTDTTFTPTLECESIKKINLIAGNLVNTFTTQELEKIRKLTINGSIDASDLLIMRDRMPVLTELDLRNTVIKSYIGKRGTAGQTLISYAENELPDYAFFNNVNSNIYSKLEYIRLPQTVTRIGVAAFKQCSGLKINFPLTDSLKIIDDEAFAHCEKLRGHLVLPDRIIKIGTGAFMDCKDLIYVSMPGKMRTVRNQTFARCENLMGIDLQSVDSIRSSAFFDCSVVFDFSLSKVKYIADNVFVRCKGITDLTIPESVKSIGQYTFAGCYGLKKVIFSEGFKEVPSNLFTDCYSLRTVYFPSTMTFIGNNVFSGCQGIESIYAKNAVPIVPPGSYFIFYGMNVNSCKLFVPTGSLSLYQSASQWKNFYQILENTLTHDKKANNDGPLPIYSPEKQMIYLNNIEDVEFISIVDMSGRTIYQGKPSTAIQTTGIASGYYLLKLTYSHYSKSIKLRIHREA